jgi:branched-chain amino acid transport system ATP-binding protein
LTPLIELAGAGPFCGPIHSLPGVSLGVGEGELVALLGGEACGRSTPRTAILGVRPGGGALLEREDLRKAHLGR